MLVLLLATLPTLPRIAPGVCLRVCASPFLLVLVPVLVFVFVFVFVMAPKAHKQNCHQCCNICRGWHKKDGSRRRKQHSDKCSPQISHSFSKIEEIPFNCHRKKHSHKWSNEISNAFESHGNSFSISCLVCYNICVASFKLLSLKKM